MNDEDYINALLTAKPDNDFPSLQSKVIFSRMPEEEKNNIYIKGDEYIEEDGTYIRIVTDYGEIYISREMIQRLSKFTEQGGDEDFDL